MQLACYIIVSWLVAACLFTTIRDKEVIRSIIIYFIFTMLVMSTYSLVYVNHRLVLITEDKSKYLSFLMSRDIIVPLLTLIFINLFYRLASYKKIVPLVFLILFIAFNEFIQLRLGIVSYVRWSFGLMLLLYIVFVLIALIISKYINAIQLRSEKK